MHPFSKYLADFTRPKILLIALLSLVSIISHGQKRGQAKIDSLVGVLPSYRDDTNKVNLFHDISFANAQINPSVGLAYATQEMDLARRLAWKKGIASAHTTFAANYISQASYEKCITEADEALALFNEVRDSAGMAVALSYLTMGYTGMGAYGKALEYGQRTLNLDELRHQYRQSGSDLNSLATIYEKLDNYPLALEKYFNALKIYETLKNKNGTAAVLSNIGRIYFYQSGDRKESPELQKALEYVSRALAINEETGNKTFKGVNYIQLGNISATQQNYGKALEYNTKALELFREIGNTAFQFNAQSSMAANSLELKKYREAASYLAAAAACSKKLNNREYATKNVSDFGALLVRIGKDPTYKLPANDSLIPSDIHTLRLKAKEFLLKAITMATEDSTLLAHRLALENLADIEEQLGNYEAALSAFSRYVAMKDSIFSTDKGKEIARLETKYEDGKREDSLRYGKQLAEGQLAEQNLLNVQQRQLLSLNQQQLLLTNKEKDLQRLAFLKTQADLQIEQGKRGNDEKALTIVGKENTLQATALKLQQAQLALKDKELSGKQQQRNFFVSCSLLILGFSTTSFYRYRKQKRLERERAVLDERLRISRDLHDDIGATLSSISVYSTAVKQRLEQGRTKDAEQMLDTISSDARDMVNTMSEMVWMINPQNDLMEKLLNRMELFATNVLSSQNVLVHFSADESLSERTLNMDTRKNVFLIYKEAINNIAKYAGATDVTIRLEPLDGGLHMSIRDNGRGFNTAGNSAGNGLRNMQERAGELRGSCCIESTAAHGTKVSLICTPHYW